MFTPELEATIRHIEQSAEPPFLGQEPQYAYAGDVAPGYMAAFAGPTAPSTADPDFAPSDAETPPEPVPEKKGTSGRWWMLGIAAVAVGLVYFAVTTPVAGLDEKKQR